MTPEELIAERQAIEHWKKARKFNPKSVSDWLDLVLKAAAVGVAAVSVVALLLPLLFPLWANMPAAVAANTTAIEQLGVRLSVNRPQVIDFKGTLIPDRVTIPAGDTLGVSMVVRRNVSCDTDIRVRFYNHSTNNIQSRFTYDIVATKAPVSTSFTGFSVQVYIPEELPPGLYSYFPEILPRDCGVYEPVISPMSLPFSVS